MPAGHDGQFFSAITETILGKLVAVAADEKEHFLVHQPGLVEGHDAVAVGEVAEPMDGLQLDQRHAPSALIVDDLDFERPLGGLGRGESSGGRDREQDEAEAVGATHGGSGRLFQDHAPTSRQYGECPLVRNFQREQHVWARLQEQRHVGQRVAHGQRLDVAPHRQAGFVGRQRQRFAGGSGVVLPGDLFPDCPMDSLRVAGSAGKQIED